MFPAITTVGCGCVVIAGRAFSAVTLTLSTKLALSSVEERSVKLRRVDDEFATNEKVSRFQLMFVPGLEGVTLLLSSVALPVT